MGFHLCVEILSHKSSRSLLMKYTQRLCDKGLGPRNFDPYKYRQQRRKRGAGEDLDGDDVSGSDDEDECEELTRVQEAIEEGRLDEDGYQPQTELFPSAQAAAAASPSQEDMISADDFDVGCDGTRGRKCKNMLNANVGLTDLNAGRSAYLSGCLKPYKVLVERIQRTEQPEQHLLARRIRQF